MTGIGYMLPMIIGSSLVVAIPQLIALAMGITSLTEDLTGFAGFLYDLQQVGWTGIGLVNTVLAAFVGYSIADKPGLAAGLVGGAVATDTQAGFIGAVIYAFIGGYLVRWAIRTIKVPEKYMQIMPNVVLPFAATFVVAVVAVLLATPLAAINNAIVTWLQDMCSTGTNKVIMAVILGAMIGFDMGGPVNKAAWMAGNALLAEGIFTPNVFINCAITIPPLGYAIAAVIRKSRFSTSLRDSASGKLGHELHRHHRGRHPVHPREAHPPHPDQHHRLRPRRWRGRAARLRRRHPAARRLVRRDHDAEPVGLSHRHRRRRPVHRPRRHRAR